MAKPLTFKYPKNMNLITLLLIVLCIISPVARYTIGTAFVVIGQTLQGETK